MKYKVLIITDSLGFPRKTPEYVSYEETYIALLKRELPNCDIIHYGNGGATIVDLFNNSLYYHETLSPDIVFIQSGIVDCAPRVLKIVEQLILNKIPLISTLVIRLIKKYSGILRKIRNLKYTNITTFEQYVNLFEKTFSIVYWIGILPSSIKYEEKLPGIKKSIELYNSVLSQTETGRNYISVGKFAESDIMSDFHHLTKEGHFKLFKLLNNIVKLKIKEDLSSSLQE